jgi:hypothetical protein
MENKKKATPEKEPFKPEDTPKPPQRVEPTKRKQQSEDKTRSGKHPDPDNGSSQRSHLLNEEADIEDETTI